MLPTEQGGFEEKKNSKILTTLNTITLEIQIGLFLLPSALTSASHGYFWGT